ncbi:MAG: HTH domain-containing protein [Candidatus Dadabacteria bacterium]|nr:HTH domain-containing protein [Candidatus Dadabacteria bacterium]MDE0520058.1 HTH domain-containing protein [Candidatus Dadabacteria bacterium]MDE0663878.1 HTH domain-containing protein [Candidatus Dadabacteria bacterium]
MSIREAIIAVLENSSTPLHVKEITKRILSRKLWKISGKTPEATVGATIYSHIKKNGDTSPFVLHAPATFGLRKADYSSETRPETITETAGDQVAETQRETSFSFMDSAQMVLERFADRQPMHYREITDKAVEMGWLSSKGKTPELSMNAQILTSIKRSRRRGEQPRFTQHGSGLVGLSKWMSTSLPLKIERHNKKVRKELHEKLLKMEWEAFEKLVARLLGEMGFEEIEVTNKTGDGGIDVRGTLLVGGVIRTRMAVQVKRWKNNVPVHVVREVRGSLAVHEQGLIITTSDFAKGAREDADRKDATPVALMNGDQLVVLLVENGIWVRRRSHDLIELEDGNFSVHEHGG